MALPLGKLDARILARLLAGIPSCPEVVVGPGIGHDVTVIDTGGPELLLAKTDPITFATADIGYYAVAVNANDLATSGGRPRWFLGTLLLPAGTADEAMVAAIYEQIKQACAALEVALVGGHTEVTHGLDRPVLVGQMLGQVAREDLVQPGGMQVGDVVLLTKGIPVEGVSLIARERRDELLARGYEEEYLARAANFLHDPGIMILPEARALCERVRPHAMHDPTEGGLATGLWEMAEAAGVGLRIDREAVPILREGRQLCAEFGLEPLGTLASGSLLAAVSPAEAPAAVAACREAGVACSAIGEAVPPAAGVLLVAGDQEQPLPRYDQDEITRLF